MPEFMQSFFNILRHWLYLNINSGLFCRKFLQKWSILIPTSLRFSFFLRSNIIHVTFKDETIFFLFLFLEVWHNFVFTIWLHLICWWILSNDGYTDFPKSPFNTPINSVDVSDSVPRQIAILFGECKFVGLQNCHIVPGHFGWRNFVLFVPIQRAQPPSDLFDTIHCIPSTGLLVHSFIINFMLLNQQSRIDKTKFKMKYTSSYMNKE